jgi:hypothetical protein
MSRVRCSAFITLVSYVGTARDAAIANIGRPKVWSKVA